jgi:hypothetical protein
MADQPITTVQETKPTFGAWLKSFAYKIGNFFIKYPFVIAATVLLVVGAALAMAFGQKIQIGGLLGWLWNRKTHDPDAIVTTPPPDRKDPTTGQVIQPGQADSVGFVQAPVVVQIKPPSILSDPTTIKVTPPGKPDVVIKLPTGVKNKDVKQVVMVAPNTFEVANHDKGVDVGKILKGLK